MMDHKNKIKVDDFQAAINVIGQGARERLAVFWA